MADEEEDKFGYYRDHFTWSMRQAEALRKRDLDAIEQTHGQRPGLTIVDNGRKKTMFCLLLDTALKTVAYRS